MAASDRDTDLGTATTPAVEDGSRRVALLVLSPDPPAREEPGRAKRALAGRALEWLLRRDAIARARSTDALGHTQRVCYEYARSLAAIAEAIAATSGAGTIATEEVSEACQRAAAITLYREAALWAMAAGGDATLPASLSTALAQTAPAASGFAGYEHGRRALERSSAETMALGEEEQAADLAASHGFVRHLLRDLRRRANPLAAQRSQRWWRIAMVALLAALAVVTIRFGVRWAIDSRRPDVAPSAHWKTSSHYDGFLSEGVGTSVRVSPWNLFFCTAEQESPWIDFDLGEPRAVYRVVAHNRTDCCSDRTVPLVVELSNDDATWTQVAQRSENFVSWEARFSSQQARYVRLRIARTSYLHLENVEIH